jgi:Flp pilus assembly protein TadD
VYARTARHDFVNFDDDHYVYENPHVRKGLAREALGWAFTAVWSSNWHPVTWLSHMLDVEIFGLKAGCHHLVNVFFHILNALLLYLVLKGMTGAAWRSAMAAALFALHPLHVESVAWVSERKDVLSTLFFLLTLWAYGRYANLPSLARYVPVLAFLALGLAAKPMLVTLPFVLLLLDFWPLGRLRLGGRPGGKGRGTSAHRGRKATERGPGVFSLLVEKIPLFALAAASSVITFLAQHRGGSTLFTQLVPLRFRVENALISYAAYLVKTAWPTGLAALYPYRAALPPLHWAGAGVALAAMTAFAVLAAGRRGYVTLGWFWYVGTLVPVIGIVQVGQQSMADRYTYIPLIGVFIILAWGAADLTARWRYRHVWLGGCATLVILGCMMKTWAQVGTWRNAITLFEHTLRVTRNNVPAHNNLGYALEREGRLDEAEAQYREALRIDPRYYLAHSNLGNVLKEKGRLDEAIRHYREAIRIHPQFVLAHTELGLALAMQGSVAEAVASHREALRLAPEDPNAHSRLGVALLAQGSMEEALEHCRKAVELNGESASLRNNLGYVLARQGRAEEAAAEYREALRLDPKYAKAHVNLGFILAAKGDLDEAIGHFRTALALDPEDPEAHLNLAMALGQKGGAGDAIDHYREAIRLSPQDPRAYNNLAWIRATHPDPGLRNGAEAVELAEKACELRNERDVHLLDTLAAAYAEAGRFAEAVAAVEQAIELADAGGPAGIVPELEERLRLHKAGLPYREVRESNVTARPQDEK